MAEGGDVMKYDREFAIYERRCMQQDGEAQMAMKTRNLATAMTTRRAKTPISRKPARTGLSNRALTATTNSFSKSIVNAKAKRRQYAGTASEADKVHG